jgi:hypothetical protein
MIAQLFLVALGAFRGRLLVLSPTDDHHAHRAGFCTGIHPHHYYDVTKGVRVPVGTRRLRRIHGSGG